MFDCPEYRAMYLRRLRTAIDNYLDTPGYLENRVNTIADTIDPPSVGLSDADQDLTKWGTWSTGAANGNLTAGGAVMRYHDGILNNTYLAGRRTFLNSTSAKLYYTGGAFDTIPPSQPANAAALITIETIDYNPASGSPRTRSMFVIRNSNTYAVDTSPAGRSPTPSA